MSKVKPVALLALDTRSFGPAYCEFCDDEELEDVILSSDARICCPVCGHPLKGFEDIEATFVSASPVEEKEK